jgi:general secretion pathway protein K
MMVAIASKNKQQGAALVVAMLILSVIVILASTLTLEHSFNIRRISNQITQEQAYQYLRATEAIAHKVLWEDAKQNSDDGVWVDNLGDIWAQEAPPFVLDDGAYTGRIFDLQGRFNLNSLRPQANTQARPPTTVAQGIFIRLLQSVGDENYSIDYQQAQNITEAIVDWLDEDSSPTGFECGEDDAYYAIDGRAPHRTPNQPFYSVSELRLICNMPFELYYRLQHEVTVWPLNGAGVINLNTASDALLRSVVVAKSDVTALQAAAKKDKANYIAPEPVSLTDLEDIRERLDAGGYEDFITLEGELDAISQALWPGANLGLHSEYFLLESAAKLGDLQLTMESVFYRKDGTIYIATRSINGL